MASIIYPNNINLALKRIKNIIILYRDFERAAEDLDNFSQRPFDDTYFTQKDIDNIIYNIDMAIIYCHVECSTPVMECLANIRSIIDRIFVNNLLLVNRLFKENVDIGTLSYLPDLVKFELHKNIYGSL